MRYRSTSKKRKKFDDPNQMTIAAYLQPETPPEPYSMNIDVQLRHAVKKGVQVFLANNPDKEEIDICTGIYKLTGIEVPLSTLNNWTFPSRAKSSENIDNNGNKRWGISVIT
jgi:hypothetical protein